MATDLRELGEFELIKHITANIEHKHLSTLKGIGDDAAVISANNNKVKTITNDLLVEGIHFDLVYTPLKHLGYKAVVVNLSDLYAMNSTPQQIIVGIALSSKFSLEALEQLYDGIKLACKVYNVDLIGGDTTSSLTGLMISITAIGCASPDKITYRNGAKENDLICVTGDLGAAYLGVQILEREKRIFEENPGIQPKLDNYKYVVGRQLKPEARKDIIELLDKNNIKPTSMIDISDGLSSEIIHICSQSKTGCRIYEDKIPISKETEKVANELNIHPLTSALNGGEDYELLFTVNIKDYEKIKDLPDIHIIGHITNEEGKYNLINNQGLPIALKALGWKNFSVKQQK